MKYLTIIFIIFFTTYANAQPQFMGTRSLRTNVKNVTIKLRVFYPTSIPSIPTKLGSYTLDLSKNVPIIVAKHPLIAISHGLSGGSLNHHPLARKLVDAGFVVVAVSHPNDLLRLGNRAHMVLRPLELSAAISTVLNDRRFSTRIDHSKIGAFGYSLGGYTALTIAGGISDFSSVKRHCAQAKNDPEFCTGETGGKHLPFWLSAKRAFYKMPNVDIRIDTYDRRIKAVVLAAPVGLVFRDLTRVKIPVFLIRAEKDQQLRAPYHVERIHNLLPEKHIYHIEKNIHHYAFLAPFPKSIEKLVGNIAKNPKGFNRITFQNRINTQIVDFFIEALNK